MKRWIRLLAVLALSALVSACATLDRWFGGVDKDEASEPAELVEIVPEVRFKRLWSVGIGNGQGEGLYRLRPGMSDERISLR